jgi:hypothetical protein
MRGSAAGDFSGVSSGKSEASVKEGGLWFRDLQFLVEKALF